MPLVQDIPAGVLFVGEDKKLRFKVFDEDGVTPLDVEDFKFRWTLADDPSSDPFVSKTTELNQIRVVGTFNVNPSLNEQYVEVDVAAEDTQGRSKQKLHHALRRTDIGSRTLLAYGRVELSIAA